jgi:hypothetical protein
LCRLAAVALQSLFRAFGKCINVRSQQNREDQFMLTRFLAATCCLMLLSACDEGPKDEAKQASICKGLSETECTAKAECVWKAEKEKCKEKDADGEERMESTPPATDETAPSEPAPPPQ